MARDPSSRETLSARRDTWREQLFFDDLAQRSAARRRAAGMRWAVLAGVLLGIFGSVAFYV